MHTSSRYPTEAYFPIRTCYGEEKSKENEINMRTRFTDSISKPSQMKSLKGFANFLDILKANNSIWSDSALYLEMYS